MRKTAVELNFKLNRLTGKPSRVECYLTEREREAKKNIQNSVCNV